MVNGHRHSRADPRTQYCELARRWLRGEPIMSDAEQLRFFSVVAASEDAVAAAAARAELLKLLARTDTGTKQ